MASSGGGTAVRSENPPVDPAARWAGLGKERPPPYRDPESLQENLAVRTPAKFTHAAVPSADGRTAAAGASPSAPGGLSVSGSKGKGSKGLYGGTRGASTRAQQLRQQQQQQEQQQAETVATETEGNSGDTPEDPQQQEQEREDGDMATSTRTPAAKLPSPGADGSLSLGPSLETRAAERGRAAKGGMGMGGGLALRLRQGGVRAPPGLRIEAGVPLDEAGADPEKSLMAVASGGRFPDRISPAPLSSSGSTSTQPTPVTQSLGPAVGMQRHNTTLNNLISQSAASLLRSPPEDAVTAGVDMSEGVSVTSASAGVVTAGGYVSPAGTGTGTRPSGLGELEEQDVSEEAMGVGEGAFPVSSNNHVGGAHDEGIPIIAPADGQSPTVVSMHSLPSGFVIGPDGLPVKRGRGRPRKHPRPGEFLPYVDMAGARGAVRLPFVPLEGASVVSVGGAGVMTTGSETPAGSSTREAMDTDLEGNPLQKRVLLDPGMTSNNVLADGRRTRGTAMERKNYAAIDSGKGIVLDDDITSASDFARTIGGKKGKGSKGKKGTGGGGASVSQHVQALKKEGGRGTKRKLSETAAETPESSGVGSSLFGLDP